MEKTTCIIIDDEPNARLLLRSIIQDFIPQLEVVAEGGSVVDSVKLIHKHKPKLVFLDIEMPVHSGLEILDFFSEEDIDFDIIFVTAYNRFAIQAFKLSAVDYLLKPIQHEALKESIERYLKKQELNRAQLLALKNNLNHRKSNGEKLIALPMTKVTKFVEAQDIVMIKGDGSYCDVHLQDKEVISLSRNLKFFEEMTSDLNLFFRSHRSYIINPRHVRELYKSDGGYVVFKNGLSASIAADRMEDLMALM